jgi:hypothetical protein
MKFIQAFLFTLAPGLIAGWEIFWEGGSERGRHEHSCTRMRHQVGREFRWEEGDDHGNRCCVHLYDKEGCRGREVKQCRSHRENASFEFSSFIVTC